MKLAYRPAEAADLCSVSESYIRKLVRDGVLRKVVHTGSQLLIAHAELERWVNEQTEAAA